MEEPCLRALAVVGSGPDAASGGHADDHIGRLSPPPMDFGEIVDDLVEATRHKVAELHFHHRLLAGDGQPQSRAHNGGLAKGSVPHASLAKGVDKPIGDLEDAPVGSNVLAHQHQVGVLFHAGAKALRDGVDEAKFSSLGLWHLYAALRGACGKTVEQLLRR